MAATFSGRGTRPESARVQRESPIWVDYPVSYSQQAPNAASWDIGSLGCTPTARSETRERMDVPRTTVGLASSQAGGLDTAWIAYNNFFNGAGHIFAGKLEAPASLGVQPVVRRFGSYRQFAGRDHRR